MAEFYGEKPKIFTKEWWPYFWMYYKWHTVIIVGIAFILISTVTNCVNKPEYDLAITYMGGPLFDQEQADTMTEELEQVIDDIDGNGEKNISFGNLIRGPVGEDPQADYAMQSKHDIEFSETTNYVYLYDENMLNDAMKRKHLKEMYLPVSEWLKNDVADDAIYTDDEGVGYAVCLKDSKLLSELGIDGSKVYLMIKNDMSAFEDEITSEENAFKVADALTK